MGEEDRTHFTRIIVLTPKAYHKVDVGGSYTISLKGEILKGEIKAKLRDYEILVRFPKPENWA